jgi:sigma-B regulation protein RsbU (phosphoserine phosphatase)
MDKRLADTWASIRRSLGIVGLLFAICLIFSFSRIGGLSTAAQILGVIFGIWLCVRWLRYIMRKAIWRLRNRLLVTYLFIAVVPLSLIVILSALGAYATASQVAVHLMSSELERRIEMLTATADRLAFLQPDQRRYAVEHMLDMMYKERFQGLQVVVRDGSNVIKYPDDESIAPPPSGWKDVAGILHHAGRFYGWAHRSTATGDITVSAPFSRQYLANLVPDLGVADIFPVDSGSPAAPTNKRKGLSFNIGPTAARDIRNTKEGEAPVPPLKPAANQFDIPVQWISSMPLYVWDDPGDTGAEASTHYSALFTVRSRPSMIFDVLFARKSDNLSGVLPGVLLGIALLFLLVELVALFIGVSMTRTITNAVHSLYLGTQRVMQGDFSHRIEVQGKDQLAELGSSFNRMTENVEQLLAVSKEKERLQGELEIAREVQNQLYPKSAPELKHLKVRALCKPARMVSGDYYDYDMLGEFLLAIALGDVAGKGISAALLMATLQSSVRTRLSFSRDAAVISGESPRLSTSVLVGSLNAQLYKTTSPEKYATFFLGVFDTASSRLHYTNAGHLPPMLFRKGKVTMLEIDGTVVGAFPFSEYGESHVDLEPGDVLLCYTDGITEPENAYGEMFGDERLIETVQRNMNKSEEQILDAVVEAVLAWTGAGELQDDMTLVIARCQA